MREGPGDGFQHRRCCGRGDTNTHVLVCALPWKEMCPCSLSENLAPGQTVDGPTRLYVGIGWPSEPLLLCPAVLSGSYVLVACREGIPQSCLPRPQVSRCRLQEAPLSGDSWGHAGGSLYVCYAEGVCSPEFSRVFVSSGRSGHLPAFGTVPAWGFASGLQPA